MDKRRFLQAAGGAALAGAAAGSARALAAVYPDKPVKFIIPFAPGGPSDIQGRMLADKLAQRLGQPFVADNRAGANGNIGMQAVAAAPPDGYTIVIASVGTWAVNPSIYKNPPFDITRDIAPVALLTASPAVLVVHPSLPVKSVDDLIALARARPGQLNFGSSGAGSIGHISGEMFCQMTGVKMVHVPYKSAAPANTDLIGGQIQVLFNTSISVVPFIKSGQMRALAVTSKHRIRALPELPTLDEAGVKGFENVSWSGIGTTGGTPREIVATLNRQLNQIIRLPDVQERYRNEGADITLGGTPGEFAAYLKSEIAKFALVVKSANIQAA
ncbi:tripartite tricarboxylate transporter substrate binding protein [Pigmentiphaga soli]